MVGRGWKGKGVGRFEAYKTAPFDGSESFAPESHMANWWRKRTTSFDN